MKILKFRAFGVLLPLQSTKDHARTIESDCHKQRAMCLYRYAYSHILIGIARNMCLPTNKQATALSTDMEYDSHNNDHQCMRSGEIMANVTQLLQYITVNSNCVNDLEAAIAALMTYAVGNRTKGMCSGGEKVKRTNQKNNK